jgi:hypothetical protein
MHLSFCCKFQNSLAFEKQARYLLLLLLLMCRQESIFFFSFLQHLSYNTTDKVCLRGFEVSERYIHSSYFMIDDAVS